MIKENTHIVIKRQDKEDYLTQEENEVFTKLLTKIASGRAQEGKQPFNKYYVCNIDEPYSEEVLKAILKGEEEKE